MVLGGLEPRHRNAATRFRLIRDRAGGGPIDRIAVRFERTLDDPTLARVDGHDG